MGNNQYSALIYYGYCAVAMPVVVDALRSTNQGLDFYSSYTNNTYYTVMKIATYNVNGVNGRLPVLLRWLEESVPNVVCLQELKAPQEKFPEEAIREAGYNAVWHGQKS